MKIAVPDLISNSYFPALAAVELGTFREEGIDMDVEVIFPPDRAYQALREGAVDLVAASAHAALGVFPGWQGVRLLCAQSRHMYWFLVLRRDLGAARGDLAALRGLKIGAAPWVEMGLRGLLAAAGMPAEANDITIAPVPKMEGVGPNFGLMAQKALEAGLIDGFWANGMAAELAVRHGIGDVILDVRRGDGPPEARGLTFASIAASEEGLSRHPGLGEATMRAIARAHRLLREDPARAEAIGRRLFPAEEAGLIATLVTRDLPFYDTAITPDDVTSLNRFMRTMGHLERDVPWDEVVLPPGGAL
ncbi:ABC transporter substrate-binding protein [Acuticoccus mangrovi]|uniref:ABC transporter substrate-binding protein n=1 Tax=Acuticoccus mangrovi TaxID=2796142 RepID=A0A934IIA4_9HYPH|nr:ABC transporter substrate-binding protein [Acuticoccus mangrovi]MBJ3776988.1 ABC transporter substrate-binding protein [Acuticoccus mangrovi]